MASYAGAYGAGAASQSLQDLVARQFLERKQAEVERANAAAEAQQQAEMAQRAEAVRQEQAFRYAGLAADRDEAYQNRTQRVEDINRQMQRQTVEDAIRAKELADKSIDETARTKADQKFHSDESAKNRAFQAYLMGQRGGETEKDRIDTERARLALEADKRAAAAASAPAPENTFSKDLDTFSKAVYNHPGLSRAGAGLNLGRSYSGEFGNLKAAANQLVNMYLNDPEVQKKIQAMRPATDADVRRALSQAVNIDVETMDAPAIKAEIDRLRTKAGLGSLGIVAMRTPDGRSINVPADKVAEAEQRGAKRSQ